jgi:hypothetical protein
MEMYKNSVVFTLGGLRAVGSALLAPFSRCGGSMAYMYDQGQEVLSILRMSGPISIRELVSRSSEPAAVIGQRLSELRDAGLVKISGPASAKSLSTLSEAEMLADSDTTVGISARLFVAAGA